MKWKYFFKRLILMCIGVGVLLSKITISFSSDDSLKTISSKKTKCHSLIDFVPKKEILYNGAINKGTLIKHVWIIPIDKISWKEVTVTNFNRPIMGVSKTIIERIYSIKNESIVAKISSSENLLNNRQPNKEEVVLSGDLSLGSIAIPSEYIPGKVVDPCYTTIINGVRVEGIAVSENTSFIDKNERFTIYLTRYYLVGLGGEIGGAEIRIKGVIDQDKWIDKDPREWIPKISDLTIVGMRSDTINEKTQEKIVSPEEKNIVIGKLASSSWMPSSYLTNPKVSAWSEDQVNLVKKYPLNFSAQKINAGPFECQNPNIKIKIIQIKDFRDEFPLECKPASLESEAKEISSNCFDKDQYPSDFLVLSESAIVGARDDLVICYKKSNKIIESAKDSGLKEKEVVQQKESEEIKKIIESNTIRDENVSKRNNGNVFSCKTKKGKLVIVAKDLSEKFIYRTYPSRISTEDAEGGSRKNVPEINLKNGDTVIEKIGTCERNGWIFKNKNYTYKIYEIGNCRAPNGNLIVEKNKKIILETDCD